MQEHLNNAYGDEINTVSRHFNNMMKENYFDKEKDMITLDEFLHKCDQWFTYGTLPVLYRDILYYLLGYMVSLDANDIEMTLNFYSKIIKDNKNYVKFYNKNKRWRALGCDEDLLEIADVIYGSPSP